MKISAFSLSAASFITVIISTLSFAETDDITWDLRYNYRNGDIEGRIQTPIGGQPGTTTIGEPSFDTSDNRMDEISVTYNREHDAFYFIAQGTSIDDSYTLTEDLISHGVEFSAGENVRLQSDMNSLHLGYKYKFDLKTFSDGTKYTIAPSADISFWRFEYKMTSPVPKERYPDRGYTKGYLRVGVDSSFEMNSWLTLGANLHTSIYTSSAPGQIDVELFADASLWETSTSSGYIRAGFYYFDLRYADRQVLPNDIRYTIKAPQLGFGVKF